MYREKDAPGGKDISGKRCARGKIYPGKDVPWEKAKEETKEKTKDKRKDGQIYRFAVRIKEISVNQEDQYHE